MVPIAPIVPFFLAILIRAAGMRIAVAMTSAALSFAVRSVLSVTAARLRAMWLTQALPRIAMLYAASYPVAVSSSRLASSAVLRGVNVYDTRTSLNIFLSIVDTFAKRAGMASLLSVAGATLLKFWQWVHVDPQVSAFVSRLLSGVAVEEIEKAQSKLQQIATLTEALRDQRLSESQREEIRNELSSQRQQYEALANTVRDRQNSAMEAFQGAGAMSFSAVGLPLEALNLLWDKIGVTAQSAYLHEATGIVRVMQSWVEVIKGKLAAQTAVLVDTAIAARDTSILDTDALITLMRKGVATTADHVLLEGAKIDAAFFAMVRDTYEGRSGDNAISGIAKALALADYFVLNPALFNPYGTYAESWDSLNAAIRGGLGLLPSGSPR